MTERKPLTVEEKKFSYAKYYDLPMTPIPKEKLAVLAAGPINPDKALDIKNRNDLFKPGYLDAEIGYCVMPDGTGFVANLTVMPEVTPEMFDWWFAWHPLEDLRYRIWDPEDHFYARVKERDHVLRQDLPMRERTWGVTHDVLEDIGGGAELIQLNFKSPAYMGYDAAKVGTSFCAALVSADGGPPPGTVSNSAAVMTHFVRSLDKGIELRSRFWMGWQIIDGKPDKVLPDGMSMPEFAPRGLFAHNLKEFAHLAVILPRVYAEEKDHWVN